MRVESDLKGASNCTIRISKKVLVSLLTVFITAFIFGLKSANIIRDVVVTNRFGTFDLYGRNNIAVLDPTKADNLKISNEKEESDSKVNGYEENEEDDDDTEEEGQGLDDYDDDEEVEDEEEVQRLYLVSGMSHQVIGSFKGLTNEFLSSEEMLIDLIGDVATSLSLDLISMHCTREEDDMVPTMTKILSCIGVTTEKGSISLYTNPSRSNKLQFNVLSSGKEQVNIEKVTIPVLEEAVSVYYIDEVQLVSGRYYNEGEPTLNWKLTLRNFPDDIYKIRNPYFQDLSDERFLGETGAIKKHVATVETLFQRIDVYDFVDVKHTSHSSHMRSHNTTKETTDVQNYDDEESSYETRHPELFQANRVIFLDGVLQSLSRGNEAYHEALVQPAMFAHHNPRRVAIIGGGEGATLREALKHKSVDTVLMIDIDEVMCKESAKLLYPAWNSCNDFFNSTQSCFDDPRADVRYEDALAFFIERFSHEYKPSEAAAINDNTMEKMDVIIMDALDPQDQIPFAEILYQDIVFWKSIYNALNDDGILVAQLGDAPDNEDPAEDYNEQKNRVLVLKTLQNIGFKSMHVYEESHCDFGDPWTFLIACKSSSCRTNWYRNSAEIELAIHQRILRSKSGTPLLKYFDGTTMSSYHNPHKAMEHVYCRSMPTPKECLFDQQLKNEITQSNLLLSNKKTSSSSSSSSLSESNVVRVSSETKKVLYKYIQSINYLKPLQNYARSFAKGSMRVNDNEFYLKINILDDLLPYNNYQYNHDNLNGNNTSTSTNSSAFTMMSSNFSTTSVYNNIVMESNDFTRYYDGISNNNGTNTTTATATNTITSFITKKENPFHYINSYSPIVDRHHYLYASFL